MKMLLLNPAQNPTPADAQHAERLGLSMPGIQTAT